VGNTLSGEGMVFLLIYPIYLALKWIPISDSMRVVQFIQGRKPLTVPAA
jgi:hypothetical protein